MEADDETGAAEAEELIEALLSEFGAVAEEWWTAWEQEFPWRRGVTRHGLNGREG